MRILVIGGTGRVGSKLIARLEQYGHDAVAAAPSTGVDAVTGVGLDSAIAGADVVVDVTNSPSFDEAPATGFFRASTTNRLAAEAKAGVGHHVALSVVGTDRLAPQSGYFRAKLLQESLLRAGSVPYTIVHATQFFEFLGVIADTATVGDTVHLPDALIQPMASDDVAEGVAIAAIGSPANGVVEVCGPRAHRLPELIGTVLAAHADPRSVRTDPAATYWGVELAERMLLPGPGATTFGTRVEDWLATAATAAQ